MLTTMTSKLPAHPVMELARFEVEPANDAETARQAERLFAVVREHFPGLLSAARVRLGAGQWVDVVLWRSRAEADAAAAGFGAVPELVALTRNITQMVEMLHGDVAYATPG
jgi:hypothetical protein